MKNFGLKELILINPKCSKNSKTAHNRAKHAQDILNNSKVKTWSYLKRFDYLIGTTAKIGTDYNISRSPITPSQLSSVIPNKKVGLIFGRESSGLTNEEISRCDFIVTIPTSPKYPSMNLSHSAAILFYELFKHSKDKKVGEQINPTSRQDKEQILKMVSGVLDKIKFATKEKKETQKLVWKRIVNKAFLTKREAFAVMGFFRKLLK
jgi:TrmH family RNA methyltransferase